jgi:hypothetical protein
MAEPVSTSAGAIFTIAKAWSILAGVCGSVVPILALSDQHKTSFKNALFMALVGSSFAIFMGPWIADNANVHSTEGVVALSWALGAVGVYVIRAVLRWLDKKGEEVVDQLVQKVTSGAYRGEERPARQETVVIEERRVDSRPYEGPYSSEDK